VPIFHCIVDDDATPEITRRLLRVACLERGVGYIEHDAKRLDPLATPLPDGSLLYRAGNSVASVRAEMALWQPGVMTFDRGPLGPLEIIRPQHLAFSRVGLPVPRSVQLQAVSPPLLYAVIDHLGGLPVIVKVEGGEGGIGVARLETFPALLSTCQLLLSQGIAPRLLSYVPDAMHWRVIVLGDRVLTAYRNPLKREDFRSEPSSAREDYGLVPSDEVAEIAIDAARVARTLFAGVDVLVHSSGRAYLLEANSPCFFAQATEGGGVDVAGPMLDFLLQR
jgi:hypothetical protein